MKKCEKCGAPNPMGVKTCEKCNHLLVQTKTKKEKKEKSIFCLIKNKVVKLNSPRGEARVLPIEAKNDITFRLTGFFILVIGVLITVFLVSIGFKGYSVLGLGPNKEKNIPMIYVQDGTTLKFTSPLVEEPFVITKELDWDDGNIEDYTLLSTKGKKLLYMNYVDKGVGDLYVRNTTTDIPFLHGGDARGDLIDKEVLRGEYLFSTDEKTAVYRKQDNTLMMKKGKNATVLASDVTDLIGISNADIIYYTTRDINATEGTTNTKIHGVDIATTGAAPFVIAENVRKIFSVDEAGEIIYGVAGRDALNPWNILSYDGETTILLAENVHTIWDISTDGKIFYSRLYMQEFDPFKFFFDDYADRDAVMVEPVEEDFMIEKKSLWGTLYETLDERKYDKAVKAYEAKVQRDLIRVALNNDVFHSYTPTE